MRTGRLGAAVVGVVLVAAGCGARLEVLGLRAGDGCPVVPRPVSSLVVPEAEGTVLLYVSNQSFANPDVRMAVAVDGAVVADQVFDVCGQHGQALFPLALDPGWHDLTVTTDSGLAHRSRVDVPPSGVRWVLVSHWTEDAPHLDVDVVSEQPGFG